MPAPEPILRLRGITKRFGALVANDGISLDLAAGEVLALLGENGAGKSTLVSILFGHYVADAGSIEVFDRPLPPGQPKAALAAGIGMVHQHFTLADNLSVLDNVMLGTEPLWQPFSRRAAARERLLAAARDFGLAVDPQARIGELSVGERQRVEILKALVRGARILILDEPTAVLTPQESESLFATLAQMVARGLGVIFISHKLDEVLRVSDRIAVLRGGRLVAELPARGARKEDLAEAMVGRAVAPAVRRGAADTGPAPPPLCELRGATLRGGGARPLLDGVSLALRAGEVVAVAGVAGNGQAALAEVLCGERALDAGPLQLDGRPLPAQPGAVVRAGVARIPEDRHAVGVVGDLPLWENAVLERYATPAFARLGFVRRGAARAHAQALVQRFDVRGTESGGLDTLTRGLSGGNMQKLILGRALTPGPGEAPPRLIVANQPTWGLDVGAVAYVHQQLLDACAAGAAVLLISEDLDEIFALADRVAVMHQGHLTEARPRAQWTLASIGLAMAGGADDGAGERPGAGPSSPSDPADHAAGPAGGSPHAA
jgi:simple sugar transport system ATP-binding protein